MSRGSSSITYDTPVEIRTAPRCQRQTHFSKWPRATASLLLLLMLAPSANGEDYLWQSNISGNWSDAAAWQPDGVPGEGDTATIDVGGAQYTVTLDVDIAIDAFHLNAPDATFLAAGRTLTVNGPCQIDAGTVIWRGSVLDGTTTLVNNATIIAQGVSTFNVSILQNSLFLIQGSAAGGHTTITLQEPATNSGTWRFDSIDAGYNANLTIASSLTNTNSGVIEIEPGTGGTRNVTGDVTNAGEIAVAPSAHLRLLGPSSSTTYTAAGGTITGSYSFENVSLRLTASPPAPSTIVVTGADCWLLTDVLPDYELWVRGSAAGSHTTLHTLGAPQVFGSLRLESTDAGYTSNVLGALTNTVGGLITVVMGSGGSRVIDGNFVNAGEIDVAADTLLQIIDKYTAAGGVINGPHRLESVELWITDSPPAPNTLVVTQTGNVLYTDVFPGYELWIHGNGATSHALLTSNGSFTNNGTIRLESSDSTYESNLAVSFFGTLMNGPQGQVLARLGSAGERKIQANVVNQGAIEVEAGTLLTLPMFGKTFAQQSGAIIVQGEMRITDGSFDFAGGDLSGSIVLVNSTLGVQQTVTTPAELILCGSHPVLTDNSSAVTTVWIRGSAVCGHTTALVRGQNAGTIRMESTDGGYACNLNIDGVLVNTISGTIQVAGGAGGGRIITGNLTNAGVIAVAADTELRIVGPPTLTSYTADGGVITGPGRLENVTLRMIASPSLPTRIEVTGNQNILDGDILQRFEVWIHGRGGSGQALLTSVTGFVNHGTLTMESTGGGWESNLAVSTGTLENASDGIIQAELGAGGPRRIGRDNSSPFGVSIVNRGTIRVKNGTTLTLEGLSSTFQQVDGSIASTGTFRMNNGTFEFVGGSTSGDVNMVNANIDIAETVAFPSTVYVTGETGVLQRHDSLAVTLAIRGGTFSTHATLNVADGVRNLGNIVLESINGGFRSNLTLFGTFTNAETGIITARTGSGGERKITGVFGNDGTIVVEDGTTLFIDGAFQNFADNTLAEGVYELRGTLTFTDADIVTNRAHITLDGPGSAIKNQNNTDALANLERVGDDGVLRVINQRTLALTKQVTNEGNVEVGEDSTLDVELGYVQEAGLTVVDGTLVTSLDVVNLRNGILTGTGRIEADLDLHSGTVGPGSPLGILFVDGDYTHVEPTCGGLAIQIDGPGPLDYDQTIIQGHAELGGTLEISLIGGFQPALGDRFSILRAGSLAGVFDDIVGECLPGNRKFDVLYDYPGASVTLEVIEGDCAPAPLATTAPERLTLPTIHVSSDDDGEVAAVDVGPPCIVPPLSPTCEPHPDWSACDGSPQPCPDVCCTDLLGDSCPGCAPPGCEIPNLDDLSCELAILNAGPKAAMTLTWQPIECRTSCDGIYNSANDPLAADAVTYDNDNPAFYRWTFELPADASAPSLEGWVNCDDQCVVFLNGNQLTGTMGCWTWGVQPGLPHPPQDAQGRLIMNWPTLDPFGASDELLFKPGEINDLIFAVSGNSSVFEPSGLEFDALVTYVPFDCTIDTDGDGLMDCNDPCPLYDDRIDCNANGVADGCDIHRDMTSADCNSDEIPDECQFQPQPFDMNWDIAVLLDGSGSISSESFQLVTEGLARAVENATVIPHDQSVTLAVIQFSGDIPGGARIEIDPVNIDSTTTALQIGSAIRAISQVSGGTPLGEGVDLAVATILPGRADAQHVITLLTDGQSNGARNPILAADDAVLAGIDEIDAIGVGGFDLSQLSDVVRPQPNSPGPPASPGFVIQAGSFEEVQGAFSDILETVLNTLIILTRVVPSPVVGVAYDAALVAGNECGSTSWALLGGQLPPGFSVSGDGHIIGLADRCGAYSFEVQVIDESGAMATRRLGFAVADPLNDGDVDLEDFARFQVCFGGADVPITEFLCRCFDVDADNDIDLVDFATLHGALTGPR